MDTSGGNVGGPSFNRTVLTELTEQADLLQELIDPAALAVDDELVLCAARIRELVAILSSMDIDKS